MTSASFLWQQRLQTGFSATTGFIEGFFTFAFLLLRLSAILYCQFENALHPVLFKYKQVVYQPVHI